jgi:DNA-binding beta-propeller fold protein YncE
MQAARLVRATSPCPCLYVTNHGNNSVTVYASGATANAKPIQTISGTNTGLFAPYDLAVDSSGGIYVANEFGNSVTVYAAGANDNAAPINTIKRPNNQARLAAGYSYPLNWRDIRQSLNPGAFQALR